MSRKDYEAVNLSLDVPAERVYVVVSVEKVS